MELGGGHDRDTKGYSKKGLIRGLEKASDLPYTSLCCTCAGCYWNVAPGRAILVTEVISAKTAFPSTELAYPRVK